MRVIENKNNFSMHIFLLLCDIYIMMKASFWSITVLLYIYGNYFYFDDQNLSYFNDKIILNIYLFLNFFYVVTLIFFPIYPTNILLFEENF